MDAGANDVTLDNTANDFTGAVSVTGNAVTLTDTNALDLGLIAADSLDVTAGGDVTQSAALDIATTTTVDAGANDVTLDNTANDFTGAVAVTGNAVTLTDTNALDLGSIAADSLDVTAGGDVTQSAALDIATTTIVDAGANDVTLDNTANDFTCLLYTSPSPRD